MMQEAEVAYVLSIDDQIIGIYSSIPRAVSMAEKCVDANGKVSIYASPIDRGIVYKMEYKK